MVKRHGVDARSVGVVLVLVVEDTAIVPWHRRSSNVKNYMLNKPNFPALRAPVRWRRRCDCPATPCQR